MFKVRRGGCEEIPLVQGKEQWLCFAGAALKRYPTSKVRETQVRWKVFREGIRVQTDLHQGTVAARAQESLEELLHFQGQEGRP